MSAPRPRRLAAWHIVRDIDGGVLYLALPLLNGNESWTSNTRLAAAYWKRSEAADVLRVIVRPSAPDARVVPVWL